VAQDFTCHFCTFYSRGANAYLSTVVNQKNAIEFHFGTLFALETVNVHALIFRNFELLPCYLYDCVHVNVFN
jgi:hypothetical protein